MGVYHLITILSTLEGGQDVYFTHVIEGSVISHYIEIMKGAPQENTRLMYSKNITKDEYDELYELCN